MSDARLVGATSVIRRARNGATAAGPWIRALLERRPARVVTVANRQQDRPHRLGRPGARRRLSARRPVA
jgi:hypothetical protein